MALFFKPGQLIRGQKTGDSFEINRFIVASNEWEIYQVKALQTGFIYNIKVSGEREKLASEFKLLQSLNNRVEVFNSGLVPEVYALDQISGEGLAFYVTNPVEGQKLNSYIGHLRDSELIYLYTELKNFLSCLEAGGYFFLELAPDNIIYDKGNRRVSIVDFNGVTVPPPGLGYAPKSRNRWVLNGAGNASAAMTKVPLPSNAAPKANRPNPYLSGLSGRERRRNGSHSGYADSVVYTIGVSSLLIFISSLFYYFH